MSKSSDEKEDKKKIDEVPNENEIGSASDTSIDAEQLLARSLTEGDPDVMDAQEAAVKRLSPRWEIRIQSERDPIAEETAAYREIAKEVDNRYDKI